MLLYFCGRELVRRVAPTMMIGPQIGLALVFAALMGLSWALWSNAVRAEVYALQGALTAGLLLAMLHFDEHQRARSLLAACLVGGLALANHHLMALTVLIPGAIFVFARSQRPSLKLAGMSAGIGTLGLLALAYLPLRSLAHPEVNWGAPHTLGRFLWTLSGAAFTKSVNLQHASSPVVDLFQIIETIASALTLPLFLAALGAIYIGLRGPSYRRITCLLGGIVLVTIAARVLLGFAPEYPDHHAYLLPAIMALGLLALICIAQLCAWALAARRPLPAAPALAVVALTLVLPLLLAARWSSSNQSDAWASDDFAHWELDHLPPRSLVLLAYFQTSFRVWAMHAVEGARPDVSLLDRSFMTYPGMAAEARLLAPELGKLIDSPLRAGVPSPVAMLEKLSLSRPVLVQVHPNVDPALQQKILPAGPFATLLTDVDEDLEDYLQQIDSGERKLLGERMSEASASEKELVRGALLWHDATRLVQFCAMGRRPAAEQVLADALAIAPNDIELRAIALGCGIGQAKTKQGATP